jgi:hypothetical protein
MHPIDRLFQNKKKKEFVQGSLTERETLSTVDLLIKLAGFAIKVNNFCNIKKQLI